MAALLELTIEGQKVEVWETVVRIDGVSLRINRKMPFDQSAQEAFNIWKAGFEAGQRAKTEEIRKALQLK